MSKQDVIVAGLQEIKEVLHRHTEADDRNFRAIRSLLEGEDDRPGMKIRLDRIEQRAFERKNNIKYLWAAVSTLASGAILKLWLG